MHTDFSDAGNQFDSLMNFISTKMYVLVDIIALGVLRMRVGKNLSIYIFLFELLPCIKLHGSKRNLPILMNLASHYLDGK